MGEQDRRAAALEIAQEIIADWIGSPDDANDVLAEFDENGIIVAFAHPDALTAPDAPGTVCIGLSTANWASWALTGVLADSPEATVVPAVREARDEIYAAIEAAAERGQPGERGEGT